uniref:Uncharacterized protein n=1 Tax=Panagrolaimus sp. JU765 TaxID=591449 RepID=A0AC34RN27_9BILA
MHIRNIFGGGGSMKACRSDTFETIRCSSQS